MDIDSETYERCSAERCPSSRSGLPEGEALTAACRASLIFPASDSRARWRMRAVMSVI